VALIDLLTFIVAGVVSWSIGWHTLDHYHAAVVEGTTLIAFEAFAFWQEWNPKRGFTFMHALLTTDLSAHERASSLRKDDTAAYRFFIHMLIAGLLAGIAGAVI
jgi:uncharacterized membrane protein YfcA